MPGVGPAGGEGTSCSSSPSPQVGWLHLLGFGSESAWPLSLNPAAEPSAAAAGPRCRLALWRVELACRREGAGGAGMGCGRDKRGRVREQGIQRG